MDLYLRGQHYLRSQHYLIRRDEKHIRVAIDFFLRAGRSALLQGDTATATPLLKRAEDLGKQTGQTGIVDEVKRLRKVAAERTAKA